MPETATITCPKCDGTGTTPAAKRICSKCEGHGNIPAKAGPKPVLGTVLTPTCLILGRPHQLWQNALTSEYEWRPVPGSLAEASIAYGLPEEYKVIK